MSAPFWTKAEDDQLRALAQTLSSGAIGRRLGKTAKAVGQRAQRLRVRLQKTPQAGAAAQYGHQFNFRNMTQASAANSNEDAALIEAFKRDRGVTVCPAAHATGSAHPEYVGKTWRAM